MGQSSPNALPHTRCGAEKDICVEDRSVRHYRRLCGRYSVVGHVGYDRFAIASILYVDGDDEPMGGAEEGSGVQVGSLLWKEVAAVAAKQKAAACWLRSHGKVVPSLMPAYYVTLYASALAKKDHFFAERTEPVRIGEIKSPQGHLCNVALSENTHEIEVSFSQIGPSLLRESNAGESVFAGYASTAAKALDKANRLEACSQR